MATWLCHLRVAERVLEKFDLPRSEFLAGNIAADCGTPDGSGGFDPPKEVTHWTHSGKAHCEYLRFAEEMLPSAAGEKQRAFLLGYFSHLIADVVWTQIINEPAKARYRDEYDADRTGYYRRAKAEWHANDLLFLEKHPDFAPLAELACVSVNSGILPYYKSDSVNVQIKNIAGAYSGSFGGCEFRYITPAQADGYVEAASDKICAELLRLGEKPRSAV